MTRIPGGKGRAPGDTLVASVIGSADDHRRYRLPVEDGIGEVGLFRSGHEGGLLLQIG